MALTLTPEQGLIFRITHRANVPWILEHGFHAKNGTASDPAFQSIGNVDLIDKRARRVVPVEPGGTLSDYVPFYFTPFSIMLYNIKTGYGVTPVAPRDVVIFVSSLYLVASLAIPFVYTNQHAYPPMAEYFSDIGELTRIDWPLLQSRDFQHDPDDPAKKERYQAEALIWKHLPVAGLKGVCCYDGHVEKELQAEVERRGVRLPVAQRPSWYF